MYKICRKPVDGDDNSSDEDDDYYLSDGSDLSGPDPVSFLISFGAYYTV